MVPAVSSSDTADNSGIEESEVYGMDFMYRHLCNAGLAELGTNFNITLIEGSSQRSYESAWTS